MNGVFRSIHDIETAPFEDHSPLWPEKDGSVFPHRIIISEPKAVSNKAVKDIKDEISFMRGKVWGGTIQGASGVFNDRLTDDDLKVIFDRSVPTVPSSGRPASIQTPPPPITGAPATPPPKADPLLRFYEKDAEDCVERLLPEMGLTKYIDPQSGKDGRQFVCSAGRIDLLCIDNESGSYVVLELKRGDAPDKALLQILRYMSWVRQNLAGNNDVRGIILTESIDSSLKDILEDVPNVLVQYYKLSIELSNEG